MPPIDTRKRPKIRFLYSKISKTSETGTGMCPPLFWPKIYQNVLFICIGSHWKCFLSISRTFIKWQRKCWKTACSETHATALCERYLTLKKQSNMCSGSRLCILIFHEILCSWFSVLTRYLCNIIQHQVIGCWLLTNILYQYSDLQILIFYIC